jgi:hypothetical protein
MRGSDGMKEDLGRIADMIRAGKLESAPTKRFPLSEFKAAFDYYKQAFRPAKVLFEP